MNRVKYSLKKAQVLVLQGDITKASTEAIVNAANSSLMGGGGVDGAIHRAAGPDLLESCKEIVSRQGKLPAGEAVITPGFNLQAGYVIHTVGPIWRGGENKEPETLASCYRNSFSLAREKELKSIAFPAISCGVYGYPKEQASTLAMQTIKQELPGSGIERVEFYLFSDEDFKTWNKSAEAVLT